MNTRFVLVLGAIALLAACVNPQREQPRGRLIESTALGAHGPAAPHPEQAWWHSFGDEQLNRLVDEALAHNPTLEQAMARVRSARAQELAAGAALKPDITFDGDETFQRFSANYYIPPPYAGGRYWAGQMGVNLSWDLDFWGRQAALIRQTRAEGSAADLDRVSARLALAGSIAQAYLDLDRAYAFGDIAARTLEQRERFLALTRERLDTGLDTAIDLNTAQRRVFDSRNQQRVLDNERDLAVHRLAALAGHGADYYAGIQRPHLTLTAPLPIPDTLPIDLLARRPDVLAARARVDAADSGRAAAKAAFYPSVSLRAFAAFQSIGLDTLLKSGSGIYGVGPALHLPIFDAQRLRAGYRDAAASLDAAVAGYNGVVLEAVRQTADQLGNADSLGRQLDQSRQSLATAQQARDLAAKRFDAGLGNKLAVLDAESPVLAARRDIAGLETQLAQARVTLLLTLGGSFDPEVSAANARAGENHE